MPTILPQLIINGLIAGAIYALAASGFSLVYYVVKFLNFAQGAIITVGAYSMYYFLNNIGLNHSVSILLTIIVCVLVLLFINFGVYKPLRKRKATNIILLMASLAILIFFNSLILALFGETTKTIAFFEHAKTFDFGFFTITSLQLLIILFALLLFTLLFVVLKKTKLGKAMRALADNKDVAQIVGINPERIYVYTFAIAAVLGAIAGILIGMEQNLYPRMGVPIIVKGFISSIVGGITSVPGAVVGGLVIGLAENIGIWFLPSGYRDVISFMILLIFLLIRPQGILGVRLRDDS